MVGNQDNGQDDDEHDGRQGVDLRADLLSRHAVDGNGQGLHGAAIEVGDHKVVNGIGQADQKCRQDGRSQLGHDDLEKRLFGRAAQIQRGVVDAGIQLPQLGAHVKDDVGHIKGDVGNHQSRPAEHAALPADAETLGHDEKEHQGDAGDDLRVDHGDIADVVDEQLGLAAHGVDADGGKGTQNRGNN